MVIKKKTIQRHRQHWSQTQNEDKQYRDTGNTGHRHRTKTNKTETQATLVTDTERRQTIQRHRQHWSQTQNEDKQDRNTTQKLKG